MNRVIEWLERWFKSPDDLGQGFLIIAIITVGIGSFLELNALTNLGLACLGAGGVAWGVNALQRGEQTSRPRGFRLMDGVQGLLAWAWGIVLIFGGLALLRFGILSILNPRSPVPVTMRQYVASAQGSAVLLLIGSSIG